MPTLQGNAYNLNGSTIQAGDKLPKIIAVANDLAEVDLSSYLGSKLIINFAPSVDTGTCQQQLKQFNERSKQLDAKVLYITADLPFALGRFCEQEKIDNVTTLSDFRHQHSHQLGLKIADGPLQGLITRAVIVVNEQGTVTQVQVVEEVTEEPDYDAVTLNG